jgi:hypothetical protein
MQGEYQSASNQLVEKTKEALESAIVFCKNSGKTITVREKVGSISISQSLDSVSLDNKAIAEARANLDIFTLSILDSNSKILSIGMLIRSWRSLKKTRENIANVIASLEQYYLNDSLVNYFKELEFCLELSSTAIKQSKNFKRSSNDHFQEYCSLCWRLVNKYKFLNYEESKDYSNYYCKIHHPKRNVNKYHKTRNKLLIAIKNRAKADDINFIIKVDKREWSRASYSRNLYQRLHSFAAKPNKIKMQKMELNLSKTSSWSEFSDTLLREVATLYPAAYSKVKHCNADLLQSWGEWFLEIIQLLDDSDTDIDNWLDSNDPSEFKNYEPHLDLNNEAAYIFGWRTLLNIFSRYQASHNIANLKNSKGPKKNKVPKNNKLRLEIQKKAKAFIVEGKKINGAQIARELNISRERVSVILKELKLR